MDLLDQLRLKNYDETAEHDFLRVRELKDAIYKAYEYLENSYNPKDKEIAEMLLTAFLGR